MAKNKEASAVTYKAAFASTDGESVNIHYGRAEKFFVYTIKDDEGYDFLEERKAKPVCMDGKHIIPEMEKSTKQLEDCRYIIASKIGGGAAASLTARGITPMELPGTIDDAILKVWEYNRIQGLF